MPPFGKFDNDLIRDENRSLMMQKILGKYVASFGTSNALLTFPISHQTIIMTCILNPKKMLAMWKIMRTLLVTDMEGKEYYCLSKLLSMNDMRIRLMKRE